MKGIFANEQRVSARRHLRRIATCALIALGVSASAPAVATLVAGPLEPAEFISAVRDGCAVTVTIRGNGEPVEIQVLQGMQGFIVHEVTLTIPAGEMGTTTWMLVDEGGYVTYLDGVPVDRISWGDRACADSGGLTDMLPDIVSFTRDVCDLTVTVLAFGQPFSLNVEQGDMGDFVFEQFFDSAASDIVSVTFPIDGPAGSENYGNFGARAGFDAMSLSVPSDVIDNCRASQGTSDQPPADGGTPAPGAPPPDPPSTSISPAGERAGSVLPPTL